jgi:hypothetical protein
MRTLLILGMLTALISPGLAQQVDTSNGRSTLNIRSGGINATNARGSTVSVGQDGISISGTSRKIRPENVSVQQGPDGLWYLTDRVSGYSAVVDASPAGMTRIDSPQGSTTVPTSLVREYFGDDQDALRFFDYLSR